MGNSNEKPNFQELSKGSKFSAQELKSFFNKFKKDFPDGKINRSQFEALYKKMFGAEGDAKEFCGLVFDQYDKDKSGVVDFKEFILTLSVASRGSANEKLLWAFQLYDRDGNGQLTHDEIVHVLTAVYKAKNRPNPKENAEKVAHSLIEAVDDNKDKKVSEAEFLHHATNSKELRELLQTL